MAYIAYVLTAASRVKLLELIPGKFPEVIAHHTTEKYPVSSTCNCDETSHQINVIGFAYNDKIEAVAVSVDGQEFREDGKRFHITISLDRSKGAKPSDSNFLFESDKNICKLSYPLELIGIRSVES